MQHIKPGQRDPESHEPIKPEIGEYWQTVVCHCRTAQPVLDAEQCGLGGILEHKRLMGIGPDVFEPSDMRQADWVQIVTWLQNITTLISRPTEVSGFVFCGERTGNGKTHVAAGLGHAARLAGMRVRFTAEGDMLNAFRDSYGDDAPVPTSTVLARYVSVPLLIVDDMGSSYVRDNSYGVSWYEDRLYSVIDARIEKERKPMIVTTNLSPDLLEERLGARSISRLQRLTWIQFTGRDRRSRR